MYKETLILIFLALFSGLTAAQVEFTETEEFPSDIAGGESFEINTSFENSAEEALPVYFILDVESDEVDISDVQLEAFDMRETDSNAGNFECYNERLKDTQFKTQNGDDSSGSLGIENNFCRLSNLQNGNYYADFEVSTDPRLRPANYSLSIEILSVPGVQSFERLPYEGGIASKLVKDTRSDLTEVNDSDSLSDENVEVTFDLGNRSALAQVRSLDQVNVESTPGQFLTGAQVIAVNNTSSFSLVDSVFFEDGYDVPGEISLSYSTDAASDLQNLGLYRLSDASDGEWEFVSSNVEEGVASAQVDEFSVFGVFGQEPSTSSGTGGFNADVDFTYNIDGLTVDFSDESNLYNREASSYDWSFGDGSSDSGEPVSHTYSEAGSYEVELTITDDQGDTHSASETIEVTVSDEQEQDQEQDEEDDDGDSGEGVAETDEEDNAIDSLTGQFTQGATNPAVLGLLAILGLIGYMFYSGKHKGVSSAVKNLR